MTVVNVINSARNELIRRAELKSVRSYNAVSRSKGFFSEIRRYFVSLVFTLAHIVIKILNLVFHFLAVKPAADDIGNQRRCPEPAPARVALALLTGNNVQLQSDIIHKRVRHGADTSVRFFSVIRNVVFNVF